MKKLKVCVYAICKNEEKFAGRFVKNLTDADLVAVLDTGSTDNTVQILKDSGAVVYQSKPAPFRFDRARNQCLKRLPRDIDVCISMDMDEVLEEGWRGHLERAWERGVTTRGLYLYNWKMGRDNLPLVQYTHERIHARHGYTWVYPTHEVLKYKSRKKEKIVFIKGLVNNHYPDGDKDRGFNLDLLKLAVREDPTPRNLHYLGREYMFRGLWDDCIETLNQYLSHPKAAWAEERSASMRFIARAYKNKGAYGEAKRWLFRAIGEYPAVREPYVEAALLFDREKNYAATNFFALEALKITEKSLSYANEAFSWDATPYDLAAVSSYYLGQKARALEYSGKALELSPGDARLTDNHKFYMDSI